MTVAQLEIPSCAFRDFANGIQQQMFFWGQDVLHPSGNLLLKTGFKKSPSTGIKGTSCYKLAWQDGHIELYGSCAGWYGKNGGFAFIRPWKKCVVWESGTETPIPGTWKKEFVKRNASRAELHKAARPFLEWLLSYERFVQQECGEQYRSENFKSYKKVPKAKLWLPPKVALEWMECLYQSPTQIRRPRQLTPNHSFLNSPAPKL